MRDFRRFCRGLDGLHQSAGDRGNVQLLRSFATRSIFYSQYTSFCCATIVLLSLRCDKYLLIKARQASRGAVDHHLGVKMYGQFASRFD